MAVETSTLAGGVALLDGERLVASRHARVAPPHRRMPGASAVGVLGLARFHAGLAVSAGELSPFYLRPPEAELKRRALTVH